MGDPKTENSFRSLFSRVSRKRLSLLSTTALEVAELRISRTWYFGSVKVKFSRIHVWSGPLKVATKNCRRHGTIGRNAVPFTSKVKFANASCQDGSIPEFVRAPLNLTNMISHCLSCPFCPKGSLRWQLRNPAAWEASSGLKTDMNWSIIKFRWAAQNVAWLSKYKDGLPHSLRKSEMSGNYFGRLKLWAFDSFWLISEGVFPGYSNGPRRTVVLVVGTMKSSARDVVGSWKVFGSLW